MIKKIVAAVLLCLVFSTSAFADYTIEQYLKIKSAKSGQFSPDEKQVAYLSDQSGTYQIRTISVDGGQPRQITSFDEPINEMFYCPTKDRILFMMDTGGNENHQLYIINGDGTGLAQLTNQPDRRVISVKFSPDGTKIAFTANFRDERYFDIYVMDLETKNQTLVREVASFNTVEAWSPDQKNLVIATWDNSYNNNLYMLDIKSGQHRLITPHEGHALFMEVVWPKGKEGKKGFYCVSDKRNSFRKLVFFIHRKDHIEVMDNAPWDTSNLCLSENGRVMGYTLNVQGFSQMVLIDMKEKKYWAKPQMPAGVVKGLELSNDGRYALFSFSSPLHNSDIWLYDAKDNKGRRLTQSSTAGIDPGSFVAPEMVEFSGSGLQIPAFLYRPKGKEKQKNLPVIVYLHGGPESQERPDFSRLFQYFLNKGFAIFAPNVRGSSGYGKAYVHLDDKEHRMDSVKDAAMGVQWLIQSKVADPKRIGVYGGSYGGFMVLALMTEYPGLFAAGVDVVGISNFETFLERTHPFRRALREAEYGSLAKDKEMLRQISPIHKVDKITGALMVIQGANDPRVPKYEADQVVEEAKKAGVEVEYLLYEDEGHGLQKLKNKLDAYPKVADFFQRHLVEKPYAESEKPEPETTKEQ